jgi:hypothetical protein
VMEMFITTFGQCGMAAARPNRGLHRLGAWSPFRPIEIPARIGTYALPRQPAVSLAVVAIA